MVVNQLWFMNLDDLYQICCKRKNDIDHRDKMFGRNIGQLLNHISITMKLSLTSYEYIFLKLIGYHLSKFEPVASLPQRESEIRKLYPDLSIDNISGHFKLMESINTFLEENYDINIDYSNFISPAGFIVGNTTVKISGDNLINIISLEPNTFFLEATNGEIIKEDGFDEEYVNKINTDERISNKIIEKFITSFYKGIMDRLTKFDLVSDSFNQSVYLDRVSSNTCKLFSLSNSDISINLLDDEKKDIMDAINYYKNNIDVVEMDTQLEFIISSSFKTFFNLVNILPINLFTTIQSFIFPLEYSKDIDNIPIVPQFLESFEKRWFNRTKALIDNSSSVYSEKEKIINQLEMTMNYSEIKYSISLSFNDFNIYYFNNIYRDYLNESDYSDKETYEIIENMCKLAKSFYSSLSK